jgi:DNA-binding GntR family transcriptional regulator
MPLPQIGDAPVRRRQHDAYDAIREAIVDGTLQDGDVLRDEDIMSWLGISRGPVRQALRRLQKVGLVELTPGRQAQVSSFDAARMNQAAYATGVLHEHAARRSVATLSQDGAAALDRHFTEAEQALARDDLHAFGNAVSDFLLVFSHETGNRVLVSTIEHASQTLTRMFTPREGLLPLPTIMTNLDRIRTSAHERDAAATGAAVHDLYAQTRRVFAEKVRPAKLVAS